MAITYNAGTNAITVTGFNGVNDWTVNDIYLADVAGGWGRCHKQGAHQYYFSNGVRLVIGDGTTSSGLADTKKQLEFSPLLGAGWQKLIDVKANASLTFGTLVSGKRTRDGCAIYAYCNPGVGFINVVDGGDTNADIEIYATTFFCDDARLYNINNLKLYNCMSVGDLRIVDCSVDVYNYTLMNGFEIFHNCTGTFEALVGMDMTQVIYFGYVSAHLTMKNMTVINNTRVAFLSNTGYNVYLVNGVIDNWLFAYSNFGGRLYRQYELDLKVIEEGSSRTAISGAAIKIWDLQGVAITDQTTDANGNIAQQTLNFGYYRQPTGNAATMQTPHKLLVSKAGYETFVKYLYSDYKRKEVIMLRKSRPVKLCDDRLVLQVCSETEQDDRFIYTELK